MKKDLQKRAYHLKEAEITLARFYESRADKALRKREFEAALDFYKEAQMKFSTRHDKARIERKMKAGGVDIYEDAHLTERYGSIGYGLIGMQEWHEAYIKAAKLYRRIGLNKKAKTLEARAGSLGKQIDEVVNDACDRMN